jgi:hypothetical protein
MAKIKNVSTKLILIGPGGPGQPEAWLQPGQQLVLAPNQEKVLFDEDLERSPGLKAAMVAGDVTKLSDEEPNDDSPNADPDSAGIAANAILKDGSVAMEADLDLDGFKVVNLAAPSAAGDAARKSEVDAKAAKTTAVVAADVSATAAADAVAAAAATATEIAAADAAVQTGAYVQADVQTIADLANELKLDYTALLADVADIRTQYNAAVTLANELKADLAEARALANEMKAKLNTMNA